MNWRLEQKNVEVDRNIQLANIYLVTGSIFFLAFISALSIGKPENGNTPFQPIAYVLYGTFPIGFLALYQGIRHLGIVEFFGFRYSPFIKIEKIGAFFKKLNTGAFVLALLILVQFLLLFVSESFRSFFIIEIVVIVGLSLLFLVETTIFLALGGLVDAFVSFIEVSSKTKFEDEGTVLDYLVVFLSVFILLPLGSLIGIVDWETWINQAMFDHKIFVPDWGDPHWLAISGLLFSTLIFAIVMIESRIKHDEQLSSS